MAVVNADYATCVAALRRCVGNGTNLTGDERRLMLDVLQHATSNEKDAQSTELEALLVTAFAAWNAVGAGDSSAVYTAQLAACADARVSAIAGITITDIAADNFKDGRST